VASEELDFKTLFEQSLVTLNTGDVVEGTIIGFNQKEAYVDLGYKYGIIPKAQYSLDPDFKFEGNIKVGDKIKVEEEVFGWEVYKEPGFV